MTRAVCRHALLASLHCGSRRPTPGRQCDEVILLPLYPHYSSTTVGSSLNEWNRHYRGKAPVRLVGSFYRDEAYLDALIEKIEAKLDRFPIGRRPEIVFQRTQPAAIYHR